MNQELELRAFLSRQKSAPYCFQCLCETGMFRSPEPTAFPNECCETLYLAICAMREFPTALTLVTERCRLCSAVRMCIVFPGRVVGPAENKKSLDAADNASWLSTAAGGSICWSIIYAGPPVE